MDGDICIVERLHLWVIQHNISHNALRDLLSILKEQISNLLIDPRTLLKTPENLNILSLSGGQYYHLRLKKALMKLLSEANLEIIEEVMIQFNVNDLSLQKSTGNQF